MKKFRINKKLEAIALISVLGLSAFTGCGKTKTAETTEEKGVYLTQDEYEKIMNIVESNDTTESEEKEEIEEEFVEGELNINSDASIENIVDESYETYQEFYDDHGINKDQIRDMIFVLNDKYTDSEGNLVIDEDRAQEAYSNIERVLGNAGSAILQKMDNINTIEIDPEIGKDIDNDWNIITHPSLVPLIDKNISGGKATAEKVAEFEELRDYEIKTMNETGSYDRERINDFVIKMEIGDYNTNQDNMDNINKNGQRYLLAAYKNAALQFAAKGNPQTIYLEGYSEIDENIKINATNEERFLENDIITMVTEGLIDADTVNSAVKEVYTTEDLGYTVEEDTLIEKYALTNDQLKLIMGYAHYLTTMADHKYQTDMCDEEAETVDDIANKRSNTTSLNNTTTKKLVLC